jgi:hypothetical protein
MKNSLIITLCIMALPLIGIVSVNGQPTKPCPSTEDYSDSTYGVKVRRLKQLDKHLHNIYYHRNPWSADNTYMIGIQSDLEGRDWRVILYDGNGCFLKELFAISEYDWRLVWDRNNPEILYTWKGTNVYRYNVVTRKADLLKSFASSNLQIKPTGLSLNQAGDRMLVITSDATFRSYRLPDMQQERSFKATYPSGCRTAWKDERYIGYRNYISTACNSQDASVQGISVYDDDGALVHHFEGIGGGGHYDFSPDGRLAYFKMWRSGNPLQIHVVDLDGTKDRVLYSIPQSQARYVQNLHLSWPDRVNDWFVVSFFPSAQRLPPSYSPPLDEIVLINASSSSYKFLARTHTSITTRREAFWAEPLASPSSDGSRVSFNSNRPGTVAQYILWVPVDQIPR